MKRFVNGVEVDLPENPEATVTSLPDRLVVKTPDGAYTAVAVRVGDTVHVSYKGNVYTVEKAARSSKGGRGASNGEMHAPMPGLIVDVLAKVGDKVVKGDKILVLEAMKTQQAFTAPFDGVVETLPVVKGQQVIEGALLAFVKPADLVEGSG